MSQQRASQLVEAGLWLKLSGDLDGAKRLFEQALKLDPDNARARQLLDVKAAAGAPSVPEGPSGSTPPPKGPLTDTDWAMATGMLQETMRNTPVPIPQVPRAEALSSPPPTTKTGTFGSPFPPAEPSADAWETSSPSVTVPSRPMQGQAMDMVANPPPSFTPPPGVLNKSVIEQEVATLLKGAKDLLDLDDHTGAIDLIVKAQELAPTDPNVQKMRERSEQILQQMFESKLGSMEKKPRVVLKDDEIIWLNLDHRAGFVLAQIDGSVSFDDLFAVSGMSRLDTARILAQLLDEGVIKA